VALANKRSILDAIDWDYEEFDVQDWGRLRIRALSAAERLKLSQEYGEGDLTPSRALRLYAWLIVASVVDEDGRQVFDSSDYEAIENRNWNRIEAIAERIFAFNGMSANAVEELEKN
jgi:hypothetical protein